MKMPVVGKLDATPVGAAALAGAVINILLGLLSGWHWWAVQSTTFHTSVQTILSVLCAYLAGYFRVVAAKGQSMTITLTAGHLPTVQATPTEEKTPAPTA